MVLADNEAEGVIEIWDLAASGDQLQKSSVTIGQNILIEKLVNIVTLMFDHPIGTFGLLLKWGRNKVNLMDARLDLTLADIGVDFTSGTTYTLLITEWPSSPSESDESTMSRTKKLSFSLDVLEISRNYVSTHLEINPFLRISDLFLCVVSLYNYTPGSFSLELRFETDEGCYKIDLEEKDVREFSELYFGSSSPSQIMLVIEVTSESPMNETENEASTPVQFDKSFVLSYQPVRKERRVSCALPDPEKVKSCPLNTIVTSTNRNKPAYKQRQSLNAIQGNEESEVNRRSEVGAEIGYVGLVNQAMTCYLNSLLQALYMTPEFRNALYNWEYVNGSEKDEAKSIPYQLQKLFLNLQTSSKNAIETTSLTKSFGWDSTEAWQQHDIQELCRVMFDALEQKFKNTEQADLINRLYEGKMIDYVKCLECGTEKSREDTFLDIPLPVRPFGSNVAYNSVEEALGAFVQPETLDGTNQYHCETCNKKCDAHKGLKFTKFPYFLTLHLKRFDFDYNTFHRIKLNDEVTFPDVLNLNSFIPSSTSQDSICTDNLSSVPVKCDANQTTDGENLKDDCPPCNNGLAVSENSTSENHDDEDDDGSVEKSNEPSTSNNHSRNRDSAKNYDNLPESRGPYNYELFSIMIHSGSASGGHYYAYIKDFRTGEWICFNDQNVSPITYDDIQKTYGGGPTRAYYSGVYSSSSNAYMLMYRQIDPDRNALPMQVADFPKHLKELLVKMQDNEENDTKNRGILMQMYRLKVFYRHPLKKTIESRKLLSLPDETWSELTNRAYKALRVESLVDRDHVRLVTYHESDDLIDCSFEGREHEAIGSILVNQTDLLLEFRKEDETFQTYLPNYVAKRIYIIDLTTKEVTKVLTDFRGRLTQTIQDYVEKLGLVIGMKSEDIHLLLQYTDNNVKLVVNDKNTLQEEGFPHTSKIFVPIYSGSGTEKIMENIDDILCLISSLMLLNIRLPDISEDELRALGIPALEEKKIIDSTPITNGPQKLSSDVETMKNTEKTENNEAMTKSNDNEDLSTVLNKTSPVTIQAENEDWNTAEQSNSEDSSLSYSDRTLVGEGDASEDDDYPLANVDHELSNQTKQDNCQVNDPTEYFLKFVDPVTNVDHELSNQTNQDNSQVKDRTEYFRKFVDPVTQVDREVFDQTNQDNNRVDDPADYFFKIARDKCESDELLKIFVDNRMTLGTLKKLLEPHVGVPAEYFRVFYEPGGENEWTRLSMEMNIHDDGATIWIKLGHAMRNDAFKVSLYQLLLDSDTEPFKYLCECVISRDATVGQAKKEILADIKRKFNIDIPFERCRLRRKKYRTAWNVYLDHQKIKDLKLSCPHGIIVQELPDKEVVTDPSQIIIFTRRMPTPDTPNGPIQEVVWSGKLISELREKISELSGIPNEHLEVAKGRNMLPDDWIQLMILNYYDWKSKLLTNDESQPVFLENGTILYYRDSREPFKLSATGIKFVPDDGPLDRQRSRVQDVSSSSSTSRYSPRRERALKIYVDDM